MPLSKKAGGADKTPYPVVPLQTSSGAAWPAANRGIFFKFRVGVARPANGLRIAVVSPSGNGKAVLYQSDGTTLTQIAAGVSTAFAGTNAGQDLAFAAATQVQAGIDYFAFLASDNATVQLARQTYISAAVALAFGDCFLVDTTFVTPPTTQLVSGLAGSSYAPVMSLY